VDVREEQHPMVPQYAAVVCLYMNQDYKIKHNQNKHLINNQILFGEKIDIEIYISLLSNGKFY
jgi:hypothetical protein